MPSGEIPLLRLAGRMLMQAVEAAAALAREQQAARQAAVFAAMVEHSDDAIIGKSLAGQIETWNTGATRLYGYTAAEAIGQPISLLAPPDHTDELPGLLARIARGERVDHFETVRMRKDGSRVDVSLTISPIRNGAGEIIAASTIARDITALIRAREQQEEARAVAEELARAAPGAGRGSGGAGRGRRRDRRHAGRHGALPHDSRAGRAPRVLRPRRGRPDRG